MILRIADASATEASGRDAWPAFEKTHTQFVREWDKITGLR